MTRRVPGVGITDLNRALDTSLQANSGRANGSCGRAQTGRHGAWNLRALRLKEIAARVQHELDGDLRSPLVGPLERARKALKKFPNIADPGADRILLFSGIAPIAAVPSNCPHVLVRIIHGQERENYGVTYREAQEAIENETAKKADVRCERISCEASWADAMQAHKA